MVLNTPFNFSYRARRIIFEVPYTREREIKNLLSLPNFLGGLGACLLLEIFNAKSCILIIAERVLVFENKHIFLTLFCWLYSIWDLEFYSVCTKLEDLSCKLINLVYFIQAKCFMDWSWLYRVTKWTQTQNYKPFHRISRGILHWGYKTSVHFHSLPTEIHLIISIETNGSFFLYHNCSLFVFCHRLISINIPMQVKAVIIICQILNQMATME